MKSQNSVSHYNGFDVLRLVAAIMVLFGHAYPITGNVSPGFFGNSIQTIGVKIFFIISGYLITKSWLSDPHPGSFFKKRFLRIYPGLAANIIFVSLILAPWLTKLPIGKYFESPGLQMYFWNLLFFPIYNLPGVFGDNIYPTAVNGSLWSLPVEILMYLLVPFLIQRGTGGSRVIFFLATIIMVFTSIWHVRMHASPTPLVIYGTGIPSVLEVSIYFLIGALYTFVNKELLANKWTGIALLAFFAYAINEYVLGEIVLLLMLPYCVLSFGLSNFPLAHRIMGRVDLSYGIYLYGFPIQQMLMSRSGKMSALENFGYALPITALLALGSWFLIEQPALRAKNSRLLNKLTPPK